VGSQKLQTNLNIRQEKKRKTGEVFARFELIVEVLQLPAHKFKKNT